jgi:hypothetical protein
MRTRHRPVELTIAGDSLACRRPSLRGYAFRRYTLNDFQEAAVGFDDGNRQIVLHGKDGKTEVVIVSGADFKPEHLAHAVEVINEALAATPT